MTLSLRFWGVRGSIATPGADTARIGGNTSCVELRAGDTHIALDAGTGLRGYGNALSREGVGEVTLLLSHLHWDHIQGIPFFAPLYQLGARVHVVSGTASGSAEAALRAQMQTPAFPVDLAEVPAHLSFMGARERQRIVVGEAEVYAARGNHPDPVYAWRIEHGGRSVVYATDTEHYRCVDPRLLSLARGADVLIYDAQYLPDEYAGVAGPSRVGWGHSTWEAAVELAMAADVGELLLFHHDPCRDDEAVQAVESLARSRFANTTAAAEGMQRSLPGRARERAA
jgi:phosphoribosyl 1,2-cyclic phosphodiesterase